MKTKIENKIDEIIDYILSKNPSEVSFAEYKILDCKVKEIKWEDEQKLRSGEMAKLLSNSFFNNAPEPLPSIEIKED